MRDGPASVERCVPGDLCLVTTYFNPAGYAKKRQRYLDFATRCRIAGLPLFTVECAFGDTPFELPASAPVIQVRARDAMWQKERLFNISLARIPARFEKLACLDFDVIFENANWAGCTSALLEQVPLVQPFETAIWLPKDAITDDGSGRVLPGFASRYVQNPMVARGGAFEAHGMPGFAWAARRQLLEEHGHYDACVIGGGDHLIAHAACGDWSSECFDWSVGLGSRQHLHFERWARRFHADVKGRIAFVPGRLLHIWHGSWDSRHYTSRHRHLKIHDFDPDLDIEIDGNGCWEWSSDKPELHSAVATYFALRLEDGDGSTAEVA